MTRDRDPAKDPGVGELEALYRAHGEAEPDSGLDRIIRARAEQALESSQRRRPRPWITGLATAGALFLAVGIIVQQAPPPTAPETAPSTPAAAEESEPALRSAPMPARSAAEIQSRSAPVPQIAAESAALSILADVEPNTPEQRLTEVRQLLAADKTAAAKEALQALQTDHPELDIAEELLQLLETPPE